MRPVGLMICSTTSPPAFSRSYGAGVAEIYDWAARGILPHIRILAGKRRPVIRFRRSDLDRFLRERTVGNTSSPNARSGR